MARVKLTDFFITSLKSAKAGARDDYGDSLVPGLALRITDRGHRSFVLVARYPSKPKHPTRRALGDYFKKPKSSAKSSEQQDKQQLGSRKALSLDEARELAREWLALIARGKDPRAEEAKLIAAEKTKLVSSFDAVAEEFLKRGAAHLRKSGEARRLIEQEFVTRWRGRPAAEISTVEVAEAIRAIVKRDASYQAHNALGYLRRMYSWAVGTHEFGLKFSPVAGLRPKDLIGVREARERILLDDELRAVWNASTGGYTAPRPGAVRRRTNKAPENMGYPYGPLVRLLILTGLREREVADARWTEIDLDKKLWTIPAARMKGGRAHEVPLAADALALLKALPRFTKGDYVFSTTDGEKPVNGFSKAKVRLDKLSGVTHWRFHDLRRTMRTHLSALPVEDLVRELVIAHARPGLHKVYDLHSYQDEKRRCLQLWEKRLAGVLMPKQVGKVIALRQAQASV